MSKKSNWRERAKRGVETYFRKRSFPRFILGLTLLLTGFAGFGISMLLLRSGLVEMWLRYPIAVIGAYGAFLLLLRIWVQIERTRFDPAEVVIEETAPRNKKKENSWLDGVQIPDIPDGDGCLPLILVGVVLGLIVLLVIALAGAPVFIAEVFIDAFLAGVLYRRLRIAADEHWLGSAIRRTWLFVLATAVLMGIGGLCLTIMAPGSRTIGDTIEYFLTPNPER